MRKSKSPASFLPLVAFASYVAYLLHSLAVVNFLKEVIRLLGKFVF